MIHIIEKICRMIKQNNLDLRYKLLKNSKET